MVTQVKTWGNSQGIRLSKELLALAGIKSNDLLDISVIDGNMGVSLALTKSMIGESLLAGRGGSNGC